MLEQEAVMIPSLPYYEASEPSLYAKFEPGTRVLPKGFQTTPQFQPLPVDIVFDKDVAVTMRDGVTIYVDVLRPAGTEKVPTIVAWSPYGKSGGTHPKNWALFELLGVDQSRLSGLGKFEGPDPAYWVAKGYAVCNPDVRGVFNGEGDSTLTGKQEGEDEYDLIEWLGTQDWSNGKVGTCGNSYLAVSTWFAAAEQPPHLAAIAPWEGWNDTYRDLAVRGGMPDPSFPEVLMVNYVGGGQREDMVAEIERYPLLGDLWASKAAALENITVPAYITASYSNLIHTLGTFRGWRRIQSADKWLRIHNGMEWPDFNTPENQDDLRRFFDHFLKGDDNGWESTPHVRYSVMDLQGGDRVNIPAAEFPPAGFTATKFFLDGATQSLVTTSPADAGNASYDSESTDGAATFTISFDQETEVVGYPKARLWVEAEGHDDMDVFVLLQKLNAAGEVLEQFNVPNHTEVMDNLTKGGAAILKYKGSNGRLRASLRKLDDRWSTDEVPSHTFDTPEKLQPGTSVQLDIELFPVGLAFHPGEQLRLDISGFNRLGGVMPGRTTVIPDNHGRHIIHTGGSTASYVQVPVKPAASK